MNDAPAEHPRAAVAADADSAAAGRFRRSKGSAARFLALERTASTNTALLAEANGPEGEAWPDFSVLVTDDQRSGRGRLERHWIDHPGLSLAVSVLLRPQRPGALEVEALSWLPLIGGLAMRQAVEELLLDVQPGAAIALKWPNDVQVAGAKISGILAELLADASGVVLGAGLNVGHRKDQLPLPGTASLVTAGAQATEHLLDEALHAYLRALSTRYRDFVAAGGDAAASGILAELERHCATLGRAVSVLLPGGGRLDGSAIGIDTGGRLLVQTPDEAIHPVAAGDVTHLRY